MQVTVETTSGLERRMTINVPADKVNAEVDKRVKDTARRVRLDGFRPGKVPASVVKQRFGPSIRAEVLQDVVRESYVEALDQESITPAGYPRFEDVKDEGEAVQFAAVFEVFPEIRLGDFSKVEVERSTVEVTDENVEQMIESLRQQRAEYNDVDRAAANDDKVVADFVGKIDGEAFDGGSAEDQELILGSGRMIPGFEEGIVGIKPGAEKTIEVTFPEEYQNKDLAGKKATFDITLKKVQAPSLPELNEDFIKELGARETDVEAFRQEVRENMTREARQAVQSKVKNDVINQLIEASEFDAPTALVDQEIQRLRQEAVQQFGGGQQMDPNQLPRELFVEQAERRVRTGLIFSEVAKKHELEADDESVRARVEELASVYQEPESVVNYYMNNQEQLAQVQSLVLEDKVIERILQDAKVTEVQADYYEAVKRDN
ncbi:trigger factor [Natronospirillum operosum]|uniref:Trigger factor n=1 Tax=Natronospirillum operosum TaxID=2759953 RepID=A0A4Z0WAA0_9GAMM|nr:trigger factor [Natronospirillum operosum]TGG95569.1 trigger factor [Natronospirillum operosum]